MIGLPKQIINWLLEQKQDKKYEIKEYTDKRSLDQNKYYWKLLGELAKKMLVSSDELHFELIKKSCPFEEYLVPDTANLRGIKYKEILSQRKVKDKVFKVIRVYVGSSDLDTKEMTILLDSLIEECKLQGIETLTPDELAKMRSLEKEIK